MVNGDDKKLCVRSVEDTKSFLRLSKKWNHLVEKSTQDTIFLRHEWFDSAWKWLKNECQMKILSVYRNKSLIGLLPLITRTKPLYGIRIKFYESFSIPDTQLFDLIVTPEDAPSVIDAIALYFLQNRNDWNMLRIDKVPENSHLIEIFSKHLDKPNRTVFFNDWGRNPYISLDGRWDAYYSRRSRRLKKGNNYVFNKLRKAFDRVEVSYFNNDCLDDKSLEFLINEIVRISSLSWKTETNTSLDHSGPGSFIRQMSRHAYEKDWLSIWILFLDGVAVATEYQLIYHGQVYALRSDFDQSYNDYSPGSYLNWKLLESLFEKGMRSYLMGHGDNPYKIRWAEEFQPLSKIVYYNENLAGRTIQFVETKLKPIARKLFKSDLLPIEYIRKKIIN
jgi:hypothetical protein